MSKNLLPPEYQLAREIDLKANHRLAVFLNILSAVIFIIILGLGFLLKPIPYGMDLEPYHFVSIIGGLFLYIFLHEAVHALFMRIFAKEPINFGFHVWAAYAGMKRGYFSRPEYMVIALAPITILGLILTLLLICITSVSGPVNNWYWPILVIQAQNIAGSIGDYYVSIILTKMNRRVLVNDDGMSMRYYEPVNYQTHDDNSFDLGNMQ